MQPRQPGWLLHGFKGLPSIVTQSRHIHTQSLRKVSTTASVPADAIASVSTVTAPPTRSQPRRPLSLLPFPILLRSYALTALSTYPLLLSPSLRVLSYVANSSSALLNPDRNPIIRYLLKKTFYAQFCAGETIDEVKRTVKGLKDMGYKGVILGYGREIVLKKDNKLEACSPPTEVEVQHNKDVVQAWKEGNLKTVEMAEEGDFIALKFSGAGCDAMHQLAATLPPSKSIEEAITEICELAEARGVRLLFDAEQDAVQRGIDAWTLRFQRRYNRTKLGQATVYGTYQAYLRSTPANLARHLMTAQQEGFTLGVKLVRGAYMSSDPRHLFWSSKEETDSAYNGIAEALITRKWNHVLKPMAEGNLDTVPETAFVLASHNHETVKKATALRMEQIKRGEPKIEMAYGQLMGMADEVSCELVMTAKSRGMVPFEKSESVGPKAYKYAVWGSVGECAKYLVRRAEENRDAVTRAKGTRAALKAEIWARLWPFRRPSIG